MTETRNLSRFASIANAAYNSITANTTAITAISVGGVSINSTAYPGTANNASFLGGTAAASYQLNSTLAANVATMAANSATFANSSVTNTFTVGTAAYFVANGNLGIGTASPTYPLSINRTGVNDTYARWSNLNGNLIIGAQGSTGEALLYNAANTAMYLATNATERMRITANGDIGIGTATPGTKLDIYDAASAGNPAVRIRDNVSDLRLYPSGGGSYVATISNTPLVINTNNTERMRVAANGNVGINTTSPDARLSVNGAVNVSGNVNATDIISVGNSTVNVFANSTSIIFSSTAAQVVNIFKPSANGSRFDIVSGANNASTPFWNGLHLCAPGAFTNSTSGTAFPRTSHFYSFTSTANPSDLFYNIVAGNDGGIGTGLKLYSVSQAGTLNGVDIVANGNVGIGNTTPNARLTVTGTANISGDVVIGGNVTLPANLTISSTGELIITNGAGIIANNTLGTSGQVLTTNGTSVYWATAAAGVNTAAQYSWTNTHTFSANVTLSGALIANGSAGTANQILFSNGTATFWANSSSSVRQTFTATAGQTTFAVSGGYTPSQVDVFYNGVKLINGTEVTVSGGSNVVLASGAANGATIDVVGYSVPTLTFANAVAKTGDTMSGTLNLPSNGLTVGTTQLVVSGGNVGVGTGSPGARFVVISSANTNDGIYYTNQNTGTGAQAVVSINTQGALGLQLGQNYTTRNAFIYLADAAALTFSTNAIARATIDSSGHFVPATTNAYDLGSSSLRWRNIFTQDLHLSNGIGDYTVIEGEENLYLVNNKSKKTFKFALIEVDPSEVPPKSES